MVLCGACNCLTKVDGVDFKQRRNDPFRTLEPMVKCIYRQCTFVDLYSVYTDEHIGKTCSEEKQWRQKISQENLCLYCGTVTCLKSCEEPILCRLKKPNGRSCDVLYARKDHGLHMKAIHVPPELRMLDGRLCREFAYCQDGRLVGITRKVFINSGERITQPQTPPGVAVMTWDIDIALILRVCKGSYDLLSSECFLLSNFDQYLLRFFVRHISPDHTDLNLRLVPTRIVEEYGEKKKKDEEDACIYGLSFVLHITFGSFESKPDPKQMNIKTRTTEQELLYIKHPKRIEELKLICVDKDDVQDAVARQETRIQFQLTMA